MHKHLIPQQVAVPVIEYLKIINIKNSQQEDFIGISLFPLPDFLFKTYTVI